MCSVQQPFRGFSESELGICSGFGSMESRTGIPELGAMLTYLQFGIWAKPLLLDGLLLE